MSHKVILMNHRRFGMTRRPSSTRVDSEKSVVDIVRELKQANARPEGYREASLRLHGLICAKCGREFEEKDRHLLTVHHKDGNHDNNPADGSNWENLCVYCHDDEHSRGMLADYLNRRRV